jgi:hypothetical protein
MSPFVEARGITNKWERWRWLAKVLQVLPRLIAAEGQTRLLYNLRTHGGGDS